MQVGKKCEFTQCKFTRWNWEHGRVKMSCLVCIVAWVYVILQNLHLFLEFSYLAALNKAIILLITMIMHNKVGFIMILENYDVYNCKLSYILKLICTMQLLLLVFVGSHNGNFNNFEEGYLYLSYFILISLVQNEN